MKPTYSELLRDPRWQKMRLKVMERDGFKCRTCGNEKGTLNVHHKVYKSGKKPWEYESRKLVTVCESCHAHLEEMKERVMDFLCSVSPEVSSSVFNAIDFAIEGRSEDVIEADELLLNAFKFQSFFCMTDRVGKYMESGGQF